MSELTLNSYEQFAVNDRVQARQFRLTDAPELFAAIDTRRDYLGEWMPWVEQTQTIHNTIAFITETLRQREMVEAYNWGIFVENRVGGDINLADKGKGKAEIGYWLIEELTHQGIMTDTVIALRDMAIQD